MRQFDWSPEAIAQLTQLWNEGLSTAQIGLRIGVTKNSVVSKAHRVGLPERPSPIMRGCNMGGRPKVARITDGPAAQGRHRSVRQTLGKLGVVKQPQALRNGMHPASKGDHRPAHLLPRNTLPPIGASLLLPAAVPPAGSPQPAGDNARPVDAHAPSEVNPCEGLPIFPAADIAGRLGAGHFFHRSCQWIDGDPRAAPVLFCGAAVIALGKPYCAHHHARAYRVLVAGPYRLAQNVLESAAA